MKPIRMTLKERRDACSICNLTFCSNTQCACRWWIENASPTRTVTQDMGDLKVWRTERNVNLLKREDANLLYAQKKVELQ